LGRDSNLGTRRRTLSNVEHTIRRKRMATTKKVKLNRIPIAGKDYELNLPKGHLSVSQINQYLFCPTQYWLERVLGLKSVASVQMVEGTIWTKLMEATNLNYLLQGEHLPW
jgi:hypothetical protein